MNVAAASAPPDQQAQRLLTSGNAWQAIVTAQAGADRGDANCIMLLAVWRLIGRPLARDLPLARGLLRRAATIGHVDAALMEVALTANGSGAPANWAAAHALLEQAAATDPTADRQLSLLRRMAIDAAGMPLEPASSVVLHTDPLIERFPDFITSDEAAHIAAASAELLAPAFVMDPKTGRQVVHPIRTSHGAVIGPTREDLVIRTINQRIAAISGTPVDAGESLNVLRYAPGQQYRLHSDALPPGGRSQRVQTVLIYLNDGYAGGETDFPKIGVRGAPRAGDAIRFTNTLHSGAMDPRAVHAGLPVTQGQKWLATRWIRNAGYDPWNPT